MSIGFIYLELRVVLWTVLLCVVADFLCRLAASLLSCGGTLVLTCHKFTK